MSWFAGRSRRLAETLIFTILLTLTTNAAAKSDSSGLKNGYFLGVEGLRVDYDLPDISEPFGYGVSAGIKLSRHVALEVLYQDFGDADNGRQRSRDAGRWEVEGASTALLIRLGRPVGRWNEVFVDGGYHSWHLTLSEFDVGRIAHQRDKDWLYGVGALSYLSRSLIFGARYRVLEVSQGTISNAAIFAQWVF